MKYLLLLVFSISLYANPISSEVLSMVKEHEGYSKYLYIDSGGYSIGYGTNLNQGLSKGEAELLLKYRLNIVYKQLTKQPWFNSLSDNRKIALIDLGYNLGVPKLFTFHNFIWCIKNKYYHAASNALHKSLWYSQVGHRAKAICNLIYKEK